MIGPEQRRRENSRVIASTGSHTVVARPAQRFHPRRAGEEPVVESVVPGHFRAVPGSRSRSWSPRSRHRPPVETLAQADLHRALHVSRNASTVPNTCIGMDQTLKSSVNVTPGVGRQGHDRQSDGGEKRPVRRPMARDRLDRRSGPMQSLDADRLTRSERDVDPVFAREGLRDDLALHRRRRATGKSFPTRVVLTQVDQWVLLASSASAVKSAGPIGCAAEEQPPSRASAGAKRDRAACALARTEAVADPGAREAVDLGNFAAVVDGH